MRRMAKPGPCRQACEAGVLRAQTGGLSPLRDLLGGHPDPLLVEPLVSAVFLDLGEGLVDGVDQRAVFGERYPVLFARGDGLDEPDLPFALYELLVRAGEVVD